MTLTLCDTREMARNNVGATSMFERSVDFPRRGHEQIADALERFKHHMRAAYASERVLRYHNLTEHIPAVWTHARDLSMRCREQGIDVNEQVLEAAVWGHDSLFAIDPAIFGMESPEDLSAEYSHRVLIRCGSPEWFAEAVREAIRATHADEVPRSTEAKILRAADLRDVGAPYEVFQANTARLFEERILLSGKDLSFPDFVRSSLRFLANYCVEFIDLTPTSVDGDGRSAWHMRAMRNLMNLHAESLTAPTAQMVIADLSLVEDKAPRLEQRDKDSDILCLHIGERHILRSKARELEAKSPDGLNFFLPGSARRAPLPAESVHRVHLVRPSRAELGEAARIVKRDGTICVSVPCTQNVEQLLVWIGDMSLHVVGQWRGQGACDLVISPRPQALVY